LKILGKNCGKLGGSIFFKQELNAVLKHAAR
jgi:hypothetical protein